METKMQNGGLCASKTFLQSEARGQALVPAQTLIPDQLFKTRQLVQAS